MVEKIIKCDGRVISLVNRREVLEANRGAINKLLRRVDKKCLLWVYGRLKHSFEPPATLAAWTVDAVRGCMFIRDGYDPALILPNTPNEKWCWGELQTIDAEELSSLDEAEGPEYVRQKITTRNGYKAWAYIYQGAMPEKAQRIIRWDGIRI